MANEPAGASLTLFCPIHGQPAKWQCSVCDQPVCPGCQPVGFNYQVYHPACVAQARAGLEQAKAVHQGIDAPSAGVRAVAWIVMVGGILFIGIALVLLGLALFSRFVPLRVFMTGPVPGIDDIPGGRTFVLWSALGTFVAGTVGMVIGLGLLNGAPAARRAVLWLAWLEIVVAVLGWLVVLVAGAGFWDIPVVGLMLILFFTRPSVRKQFDQVL